ncbi:MAG: hypothetical protein QNI97_16390 [Desulfobacterales bacterium]|nr:hypothetical protein [Desulfobacterales bacterium]
MDIFEIGHINLFRGRFQTLSARHRSFVLLGNGLYRGRYKNTSAGHGSKPQQRGRITTAGDD